MANVPILSGTQVILDSEEVAQRTREELHPGVTYAVLWREHGSVAGLMWVEAGAAVPEHRHERAAHHVWLVNGRALVDGRMLEQGSYWHVPPDTPHSVQGLAPYGCTLFYLYLV